MIGDLGNDVYYVDSLEDVVREFDGMQGGNDTVYVSVANFDGARLANVERIILVGAGSVIGEDHPPTDIFLDGNTVMENSVFDTPIGLLSATDPDSGESFTYELIDETDSAFGIEGNVLVVKNGYQIDFETTPERLITVRAMDSHGLAIDRTFTIYVQDFDENPPDDNSDPSQIFLDGNSVSENSGNDTIVGWIAATDPDWDDTLTYELIGTAGGRFAIKDGAIVVADGSKLDYETDQLHVIRVRVSDGNGGSLEADFEIHVQDVVETTPPENHAPTAIGLSATSVSENSANDVVVGLLSATDADSGDSFTYELIGTAGGRFAIKNGAIVVADGTKLDYETAQEHVIRVRVSDGHNGSFESDFTIHVQDLDETPPPENHAPTAIGLSATSVSENSANDVVVGLLSATDADSGDSFTYELIGTAGGRFAIKDGAIVVADGTKLDYETAQEHVIRVRVSDGHGGSFESDFTIHVQDLDETPPAENHAPTAIGLSATSVSENSAERCGRRSAECDGCGLRATASPTSWSARRWPLRDQGRRDRRGGRHQARLRDGAGACDPGAGQRRP